jgi:hypothetical protein
MITQELVLKLFEYKDGCLYWKSMPYKRNDLIGTEAGTLDGDRRQITINKKHYKTHRLVYLMFHGFIPKEIDHIDNNPLNNRIENLRSANRSEQACNTRLRKDNTSGIKGVSWDKKRNKWKVSINKNKKNVYGARFDDLELAELVAVEARNKYHKEFAKCLYQ